MKINDIIDEIIEFKVDEAIKLVHKTKPKKNGKTTT